MHADMDSLRQLSLADKLHIVEVLWEDIATSNEEFPLPKSLHGEVADRLSDHDQDPAKALTRDQLWQRVDEQRA